MKTLARYEKEFVCYVAQEAPAPPNQTGVHLSRSVALHGQVVTAEHLFSVRWKQLLMGSRGHVERVMRDRLAVGHLEKVMRGLLALGHVEGVMRHGRAVGHLEAVMRDQLTVGDADDCTVGVTAPVDSLSGTLNPKRSCRKRARETSAEAPLKTHKSVIPMADTGLVP